MHAIPISQSLESTQVSAAAQPLQDPSTHFPE